MCTVTYIPSRDGFFLTSNRDESRHRSAALTPGVYSGGRHRLIYPKDADGGGSWIVLKENGAAAVLLNGAFLKHMRQPPYRVSRGVVLLEIMQAMDPLKGMAQIDLGGIEPFTLVLFVQGNLWECRWDGHWKHIVSLDKTHPHIWSSATLYDERVAKEREGWFEKWLKDRKRIAPGDIVSFHHSAGKRDIRNDLVMNRDNELYTVSVTSIVVSGEGSRMFYNDLATGREAVAAFDSVSTLSFRAPLKDGKKRWEGLTLTDFKSRWERLKLAARRFRVRLTHWEYWPTHLIYAPVYPYWLWLSLRGRSFFFFNAANPRIEYAGFTHERKSGIYQQLPSRYYPRTQFCAAGARPDEVAQQLANRALHFPLIAKPDIGERGTQVSLLRTDAQLEEYCRRSKVDFLIQEYISYEMEAGIFYVRVPGEARGRITGIVGKEFLSVTGDGRSTVRELLMREPRSLLQLGSLTSRYGNLLDNVPAPGIRQVLVPYGNHCRGAKFIDCSDRITEELSAVIDRICKRVPDFYYGRLDIKFTSWDDLLQEKNFSIIELNGAGSEPTHIYDPAHSVFFAWREIIRHWRLLFRISLANAERKKIPLMKTREGLRMLVTHSRYLKMMEQL
ncbi:MAG TPA: NRDE family protein [Puia sp.]|uniref:NRDE family protein n=1 Tax=Puia sp. TaxID=2045100 RepID=UPI002C822C27|nr:NRDE family protein [Puia sp.]HVU94449.1 NRDE family protein [Puia sp.]